MMAIANIEPPSPRFIESGIQHAAGTPPAKDEAGHNGVSVHDLQQRFRARQGLGDGRPARPRQVVPDREIVGGVGGQHQRSLRAAGTAKAHAHFHAAKRAIPPKPHGEKVGQRAAGKVDKTLHAAIDED